MSQIKQVIVMRKDLNMRRGKEIAQGAHVSMQFLKKKVLEGVPLSEIEREWLSGLHTKVCVRVESMEEFVKIADAAARESIPLEMMADAGKTEFHGQVTMTCLALGPDQAEKIDKVTGHLPLY